MRRVLQPLLAEGQRPNSLKKLGLFLLYGAPFWLAQNGNSSALCKAFHKADKETVAAETWQPFSILGSTVTTTTISTYIRRYQ